LVALHAIELWKYPYADYVASTGDFAGLSNALCEGGDVKLQGFLNKHRRDRVAVEHIINQGNASDLILSFAQKHNVELIVMGTHGRRGFDRLVLGSTTDRVIRRAACPVLVVSNPSHNLMTTAPDGSHRLSRIIYCTDFSDNSERALEYAISLTAEYDAELILLHATGGAPDVARAEAIIATRTEELDKLISEDKRKNLNVTVVVRFGKPYEEIVRHATESQTSLIVMTARGGDAIDRAVFGSTTYRVIQLGPCPVLAIHT
jgi:nucleotide-binding universal stress UspA family protein